MGPFALTVIRFFNFLYVFRCSIFVLCEDVLFMNVLNEFGVIYNKVLLSGEKVVVGNDWQMVASVWHLRLLYLTSRRMLQKYSPHLGVSPV